VDGPVEIRINHRFHSPLCERKLSDTLDFITDPNTSAAKNTFVGIPLEKRGGIIQRERDPVPGIDRFLYAIFIDQCLKIALPFLFTAGADHGVIEKNQLKLKPSRFEDLRGAGEDLHPFFCRGEAGGKEFGFSFLLDDAKTAGPKGNEPPIMTKGRDSNPYRLSGFENRVSFLNRHLCPVDNELDLVCHRCFRSNGVLEYWSIGFFIFLLTITPSLHSSSNPFF